MRGGLLARDSRLAGHYLNMRQSLFASAGGGQLLFDAAGGQMQILNGQHDRLLDDEFLSLCHEIAVFVIGHGPIG
jgi:hypothetical protein